MSVNTSGRCPSSTASRLRDCVSATSSSGMSASIAFRRARLLCTSSSLPAPSSQRASVSFCVSRRFSSVLGHGDALLRPTQLEVVACHFGGDQYLRVGQVGLLGTEVCTRGFGGTALAAEQIQLPAGIEAELVAFTEHPLPTQLRIGLLAAVVAAACGDVRAWSRRLSTNTARAWLTRATATRRSRLSDRAPWTSCSSTGSSNCAHQLATGEAVLKTGCCAPCRTTGSCTGA